MLVMIMVVVVGGYTNVEEDDEDGAESPLAGLMMAAMMIKMFTMTLIFPHLYNLLSSRILI